MTQETHQTVQPVVVVQQERNGLGITSLVLGIIATVFAFIPFGVVLSLPTGIVGLSLGLANLGRLRRKVATNPIGTWFGIVLSALGVVFAVIAVAVVYHGLTTSS